MKRTSAAVLGRSTQPASFLPHRHQQLNSSAPAPPPHPHVCEAVSPRKRTRNPSQSLTCQLFWGCCPDAPRSCMSACYCRECPWQTASYHRNMGKKTREEQKDRTRGQYRPAKTSPMARTVTFETLHPEKLNTMLPPPSALPPSLCSPPQP